MRVENVGMSDLANLPDLTPAQRLCIFYGSNATEVDALQVPQNCVTYETMQSRGCKYQSIAAAGLRIVELQRMGFASPLHLRQVGMDAIDLVDPLVVRDLVACFGADATKATFLASAFDAVALAGSDAERVLGITLDELLTHCAGEPTAAMAVLRTASHPRLAETSISRLLDTGIRADALQRIGYNIVVLSVHAHATPKDLKALGYRNTL